MKEHTLKINYKYLTYIFLIFPFFQPDYINICLPKANPIYLLWRIFSLLIVILLTLKRKKISKIIIYMTFFMIVLLFSTLLNNGDIESCIKIIISVMGLSMVLDYGFNNEKRNLSKAFADYLYILITINFVSILLNPNGLYTNPFDHYRDNWFLGFKNIHILFILPGITINYISDLLNKGKVGLKYYILLAISFVSLIMINSSTSIVGIIFIILFLYFNKFILKSNLINIKKFIIIFLIIFFLIVVFRAQNIFAFIIEDILHKDLTFTNRTYIWDYVMNFISKNPFFGYGNEFKLERYYKTIMYQSYHAHNQLLEIIYKTGFIGFWTFVLICKEGFKNLNPNKYNKKMVKFIAIVAFALMIMTVTEAYVLEKIMYMLVIFSNIINYGKIENK